MQLKSNKLLKIIDKYQSKILFKRERERNRTLTLHSRRGGREWQATAKIEALDAKSRQLEAYP